MKKAFLYLENGQVLEGRSFGASGTAMGELVFTTGMTGCVESLTDPNYCGQLVVYTFPQFGNYGICRQDMESPRCRMGGVVVRENCEAPSNFRCEETADAFLKAENVVGIAGVDTRMLTQLLRDHGVLNAVITTDETPPDLENLRACKIGPAAAQTSARERRVLTPEGKPLYSVALLDCGVRRSFLDRLLAQGWQVTVYPWDTPAETILAGGHQGLILSTGPGDPRDYTDCVEQVRACFGKIPMMGVGLGHQLMALAAGAEVTKLKFGHRGANHPVKDLSNGAVSITSQNHGYTVDLDSLEGTGASLRCLNVNDNTCAGLDYPERHAFSLQFQPGGSTAYERFAAMMKEGF